MLIQIHEKKPDKGIAFAVWEGNVDPIIEFIRNKYPVSVEEDGTLLIYITGESKLSVEPGQWLTEVVMI